MSRGISGGMAAAVAAGTVYPVFFASFDFTGGVVYACTHNQPIVWNGHTWVGLGHFCKIEPIKETRTVQANGLAFTLNGVPSSLITEVIANRSRGRNCSVWFGCFDASGTLVSSPVKRWSGRMDQPTIQDDGETCSITVTAESRMADLQRTRERRYTDADQQELYPGDIGLMYVAGMQNKEIAWGAATNTTSPATTSPYNGPDYGQGYNNPYDN